MDVISIKLVFLAGLFFTLKHFFADGPLQTEYQYKHKGAWLHPGGLLHAAIHGFGTFIVVWLTFLLLDTGKPAWYLVSFGILMAIADFVIHYLIDLAKTKATYKYGWAKFTEIDAKKDKNKVLIVYHNNYFRAIIADQCGHFLTYIIFICLMLGVVLQTPGL